VAVGLGAGARERIAVGHARVAIPRDLSTDEIIGEKQRLPPLLRLLDAVLAGIEIGACPAEVRLMPAMACPVLLAPRYLGIRDCAMA
jgi:hypothetical protein